MNSLLSFSRIRWLIGYSIEYKYEKMLKARYALTVSRNAFRDRIDQSYHLLLIKEDEFQGEGKKIRENIEHLIAKNKAQKGCVIPRNIKHMPLLRTEEVATPILELYDIVATEYLRS